MTAMKIVDSITDYRDIRYMSNQFEIFKRNLKLHFVPNPIKDSAATFLWGPRQTGKTTLLREQFPNAQYYDLLDTDLSAELIIRPSRLREEILAQSPQTVVVDEVQTVPALIDEIHWLLENTPTQFILCGSSARSLRRRSRGLLGGRAIEQHLFPLTSHEIPNLNLLRLFNHGGLPAHYLVEDPTPLHRAYINTYLVQEIINESATRNIPAFSRFMQVIGLTHTQQLNYANVARETGVSASTVRSYFQILEDTLIGFTLEPWRKKSQRRLVETAKFYLFDIGIANALNPETTQIIEGTDVYGRAFEHFLLNEIRARISYLNLDTPLSFWRTHSGFEVDLIVGDLQVALEFKSSCQLRQSDLKGLRALKDEHAVNRTIVVCREERPRRTEDGIDILPWQIFCEQLWTGEIIGIN